ncbi:MAG: hypothetical protein FJ272_18515, partial [Planctomycetes bacterium]|nr:hypothetical protein [Planctomycetota bacterium]
MHLFIAASLAVLALGVAFAQEKDSATLTGEVLSNAGGAYGWAREQKVRCIYYSGLRGGEYYQAAAAAGFNCAINKTTGLDPNAPEPGLALHAEQARLAAQAGQKYVACVNFNSDTERKFTSKRYTPLIDAEGRTYPDTPSPLDAEFWNQSIKRRWLLLAEAAKSAPITAAMIDFEMYGSEIVFYDRVGCLDYSDLAFNGFLKQETRFLGENGFLGAPKDRPRWLKDKGLEDKYVAYYRRTLEAICRDIEREVHKVNPNLILSFYSWDNKSHFYESCALGFGTPQMPVLLWPGTTYASGYKPTDVDDQVKRLREINAHAVFIPGLWLWQYHPDNLAANAYQCAAHAGGFWLYGIYSMWPETARKRNAPQMNAAEYWAALKQANDEIAALQKNPARQTALRVDSSRTLYIATDPLLHVSMRVFAESRFDKKAALQPLTPDAPAVPLDELPPAAPIRNVAVYRALGEAGKTIAFRVHSVRLG